jgi:hypothetical protein
MTAVAPINPSLRRLEAPSELRGLQGWLIWRYEAEPGTGKMLKVPYWAGGSKRFGKQGSPEDRAKLVTFPAARDAASKRGFDGVGLALLPEFGVTALDFDHCIADDNSLPPEVQAIVSDTYAEYSPSGKGVRAFVKGVLGNNKSHRGKVHDWGFETFSTKGFVTFTGHPLPFTEALGLDDHIAPVNEQVLALCRRRFEGTQNQESGEIDPFEAAMLLRPLGYTLEDATTLLYDVDPSEPRDVWIQTGMALHHEFEGGEDGFDLWDTWSSGGAQYPGSEALRTQWQSFDRHDTNRRPITMATLRKMSNERRTQAGLPPRSFDLINRAAAEARAETEGRAPSTDSFVSSPAFGGKYRVHSAEEFTDRPPIRWMIKGVLPRDGELIVLYGAPGSGKSLCALDMTMSLVQGAPWRGRKVNKARVLYIAAEGAEGVAQRLKAYSMHHGTSLEGLPLGIISDAPNLMIEEDASELVKSIIDAGGGDVIVADTWAQVTPGANENSGEDMGLALKHCRAIRKATGAIVLLIAHTGKDASRGIRGWSGLNGAANTTLEVLREDDSPTRAVKVTKQKDGRDDLPPWGFTLQDVMIGIDEDGEEITSPVVIEADAPKPTPREEGKGKARRYGIWERAILDYIATLDPSVVGLPVAELVKQTIDTVEPANDGQRDIRDQNIRRALTTLAKGSDAPISIRNGYVEFFIA